MNSLHDNDHPPGAGKQPYYSNAPGPACESPNENEEEVYDKILHEDDEDIEVEDKIDDAELDPSGEVRTEKDEDLLESDDSDEDDGSEDDDLK